MAKLANSMHIVRAHTATASHIISIFFSYSPYFYLLSRRPRHRHLDKNGKVSNEKCFVFFYLAFASFLWEYTIKTIVAESNESKNFRSEFLFQLNASRAGLKMLETKILAVAVELAAMLRNREKSMKKTTRVRFV